MVSREVKIGKQFFKIRSPKPRKKKSIEQIYEENFPALLGSSGAPLLKDSRGKEI